MAEVARLEKTINWDQFSKDSMRRFFSVVAQKEMKERLIKLQ